MLTTALPPHTLFLPPNTLFLHTYTALSSVPLCFSLAARHDRHRPSGDVRERYPRVRGRALVLPRLLRHGRARGEHTRSIVSVTSVSYITAPPFYSLSLPFIPYSSLSLPLIPSHFLLFPFIHS